MSNPVCTPLAAVLEASATDAIFSGSGEPFTLHYGLTNYLAPRLQQGASDGRCGMVVPAGALNYVKPATTIFELEALEGLPCGCVAAAYRARPWDVAVVSLEAKGPHCILSGHASGQILRLGDPSEFDEEDEEE